MADDKSARAPQDSARIAMTEDYEVEYWTRALGVSRQTLAAAIATVGNSAGAVRDYLAR